MARKGRATRPPHCLDPDWTGWADYWKERRKSMDDPAPSPDTTNTSNSLSPSHYTGHTPRTRDA